jgi:hypothetical protein
VAHTGAPASLFPPPPVPAPLAGEVGAWGRRRPAAAPKGARRRAGPMALAADPGAGGAAHRAAVGTLGRPGGSGYARRPTAIEGSA